MVPDAGGVGVRVEATAFELFEEGKPCGVQIQR